MSKKTLLSIALYFARILPKAVNLTVALSHFIKDKQSPTKEIKWSSLIIFVLLASIASAYQTDRTEPRLIKTGTPPENKLLSRVQSERLFVLADTPSKLLRQAGFRRASVSDILGYGTPGMPASTPDAAGCARVCAAYVVNLFGLLAAVAPFGSSLFLLFTDNMPAFYTLATIVICVVGAKNILCEAPPTQDRLTQYTQAMTWPRHIPLPILQCLLGSYARLDAAIAAGSGGNLLHDALPENWQYYRLLPAMFVFLSIYFAIKTLDESFDAEKALLRYGDRIAPDRLQRILRGEEALPERRRTCADILARPLNVLEKGLLEITFFPRNNMLWLKIITLIAYMARQSYLAHKASERFDLNIWQTVLAYALCLLGAIAPALSAIRLKARAIHAEHPIMQEARCVTTIRMMQACCSKKPDLSLENLEGRKARAAFLMKDARPSPAGACPTPKF